MLTQTQLKSVFREHGFAPLKRLGENYLIDSNIKNKIISAAKCTKTDTVLEIGPGLGALTEDLAKSGAVVIAVEKDRKAIAVLREMMAGRFANLKMYCADILKFDIGGIYSGKKIKVIGNLPYYITTPIIEKLIDSSSMIASAIIMAQREVANRIMADAGTKEYGSLACFVQYHAGVSYLHTIKRGSFYPVPDVDSSLLKLEFRDKPAVDVDDEDLFFKVVRSSFNQRRKSILNSLSRKLALDIPKSELSAILAKIKIDPQSRPETLSLHDFARIANSINSK